MRRQPAAPTSRPAERRCERAGRADAKVSKHGEGWQQLSRVFSFVSHFYGKLIFFQHQRHAYMPRTHATPQTMAQSVNALQRARGGHAGMMTRATRCAP